MEVATWTSIPSAGKLTSPLQTCWWQDAGQQRLEQQFSRSRAAAGVPHQRLHWQKPPHLLEWIWPCIHRLGSRSSPDVLLIARSQVHTGPHAARVIQAHKEVIKIHSRLMSAVSVLMSVAEMHSRSKGRRSLISPL